MDNGKKDRFFAVVKNKKRLIFMKIILSKQVQFGNLSDQTDKNFIQVILMDLLGIVGNKLQNMELKVVE